MVNILKTEIDSLLRDKGVYYSIFEKKIPDEKGTCVMVLYFDDNLIDLYAEINHVKARLKSQPILTEFRCYASDFFETFNSRQVQSLMLNSISDHMDIGYMEKEHVISDHFPCHNSVRDTLDDSWHEHKYKLVWGFLVGGFSTEMQPLNFIADYYGEKYGFYFAWLVHYTGQLILPSIIGVGILIAQVVFMIRDEIPAGEAFNTTLNIWYAIFLTFWMTFLVESWKRKEAVIAHKWLMRDFADSTTERQQFRYNLDIDVDTKKQW